VRPKTAPVAIALAWLAGLTHSLLTGCGPAPKGPEEEPLLADGKADSFVSPTEHGPLAFGASNQAVVDGSQRFHAWTFSLSGPAKVTLRTEVSTNLDTVMYLYRRPSPDARWGANIAKNDDYLGAIWSQIEHPAGEPGEYRVIVKPFKVSLAGSFTLVAGCEGPGCPSGGGEACTAEVGGEPPPDEGYGASCAARLHALLTAGVTSESDHEVTLAERCALGAAARRAVEGYYHYWDSLVGWQDFVYDPGEEVVLYVSVTEHGAAGSRVSVSAGGDEDTLTFVIDGAGQVLLTYHSEQSPTTLWGCRGADEASTEEPDVGCVSDALHGDTASVLGADGFRCP
jgi:hypothetical protein